MGDRFIDLGSGHFLFERRDCTLVLDARAQEIDMIFGPAAWEGLRGPTGGFRVCEAIPVRLGGYDQVSETEWRWVMPDGTELDEEPPSWPRQLNVSSSPHARPFSHLDGQIFDDEPSLIEGLKVSLRGLPRRELVESSHEGRLAVIRFIHPGVV